jgi:hypothetical protein
MGSPKYGIVGKSQPVLMMINPIIFTRTCTMIRIDVTCTHLDVSLRKDAVLIPVLTPVLMLGRFFTPVTRLWGPWWWPDVVRNDIHPSCPQQARPIPRATTQLHQRYPQGRDGLQGGVCGHAAGEEPLQGARAQGVESVRLARYPQASASAS